MNKKYDIIVAGHLCLDIIPHFPDLGTKKISQILRPGKLVNVNDAMISTGGPVSNTGLNMKTLGNNVCFCGCVGDDTIGKLTAQILQENGNTSGIHKKTGVSSSYTVVLAPPNIDRIFLHNPGTNDIFGPKDLDEELINQCRHFHFGYPPLMKNMFENEGENLLKVFKIAKEAGATTSCDMTLPDPASDSGKAPWKKILEKILPYVDIYVPSVEETLYMLDPQRFLKMKDQHNNAELIDYLTAEDYSKLADELLSMGSKIATLKSGHRGFYIKTASKDKFDDLGAAKPGDFNNWSERELWAEAYEVDDFGSATGSGDSSIAGFLSAYLKGLSIEKALKYAVCCGLQNVRVLDAVSGIKDWQATTAMINDGLPVLDIKMDSSDWNYSEEFKLWAGPDDALSSQAD